jgi:hypothetical protein
MNPANPGNPAGPASPGSRANAANAGSPADAVNAGSPADPAEQPGQGEPQRVFVVSHDSMGVAEQPSEGEDARNPAELVEQPGKVMRIASMIKQLLEEVRSAPLDEAGRTRLAEIHRRSISELEEGLAPELVDELERITLPFGEQAPSDAELRIAQAQLVGWLEGLFHGIQAALFAQQMAAQQQLERMRHALPAGSADGNPHQQAAAGRGMPNEGQPHGGPTGQYL